MDKRVAVVMAVLFSKRLMGDRLAILVMDVSLVFLGEMALLLSILFWVYYLEEIIVFKIIYNGSKVYHNHSFSWLYCKKS